MHKIHGFKFILGILFFILVSGGWLIAQIWGMPESAGSASALESPLALPTLEPPPAVPSEAIPAAVPGEDDSESVDTDAAADAQKPVVAEPLDPSPEPETTELAVPEPAATLPAKPIEVVPPPAPIVKAEPKETPKVEGFKPVQGPASSPAKKIEKKTVPAPAIKKESEPSTGSSEPVSIAYMKPAKSPSKKRKAKRYVIETVLPPEWDWFNEPLKMKSDAGNVVVYTEYEIARVSDHGTGETLESSVAYEDVSVKDSPSQEAAATPALPVMEDDGRPSGFDFVLEKMARRREARNAAALEKKIVLPSQGGASEKLVPESLRRLQDALRAISQSGQISSSPQTSGPETSGVINASSNLAQGQAFLPHVDEVAGQVESSGTLESKSFARQFPLIPQGFRLE